MSRHFFADLSQAHFLTLGNKPFRYLFPHGFKAPSTFSVLPFLAIDGDEECDCSAPLDFPILLESAFSLLDKLSRGKKSY